jgi:hypothetical protein
VLQTIEVDIHKTPFILVSYDEVTSFNNQNWLSLHVYLVKDWKRVLVLLNLQRVDGMTFDKLIITIVKKFARIIGLSESNLAHKFVCFGTCGVLAF